MRMHLFEDRAEGGGGRLQRLELLAVHLLLEGKGVGRDERAVEISDEAHQRVHRLAACERTEVEIVLGVLFR